VTGEPVGAFERCMSAGGVAVFPSDTVYGLACDPDNQIAVRRLYALKRRSLDKPSAVMFFELDRALLALPELGQHTRQALMRLLPGRLTLLLPNPEGRYPLTCGADGSTLGLRVPDVAALSGVRRPVLQSSANLSDGAEARRLDEVPESIRAAADMVIDGGELPGTASTVVDLRDYEADSAWSIIRPGAVSESEVATGLHGQFHFNPATYAAMARSEIPDYDRFQDEVAEASGAGARRMLELGIGTGETARRLLLRHPGSELVGIDESAEMLEAARARLGSDEVVLRVARLQDPLPEGPFDLVVSALAVHHLLAGEKRDLFGRIHEVLAPAGRFVLGDVVVPRAPEDAKIPLTPGFDHPGTLAEQLSWLSATGFRTRATWVLGDLAVIVAERPRLG
jgi:tRNA threonylcarbamoyl adenosine modification protein (Sua5/YciO/YrdC/YwlC family)